MQLPHVAISVPDYYMLVLIIGNPDVVVGSEFVLLGLEESDMEAAEGNACAQGF